MKTKIAIFLLVIAVVVTDRQLSGQSPEESKPPVPAVAAEPNRQFTPPSAFMPPWTTPATTATEPQKNADLLGELITILNGTRSTDTFVVTLELIRDMGPKAERAIPVILRNAERLGFLKDEQLSGDGDTEKSEFILGVVRALHGAKKDKAVRTPVGACCGALTPKTDNPVRVPVGAATTN